MERKIWRIIIIFVLVVAVACVIELFRENRRLGEELNYKSCQMSTQVWDVAHSIALLEEKFESGDIDDLDHYRFPFDEAIMKAHLGFSSSLLGDATAEYYVWLEKLWNHVVLDDGDNQKLVKLFTDPESAGELHEFKEHLELLPDMIAEFTDRYAEMSEWERWFTSWESEREKLSEKLKLPENLVP